MGDEEKQEFRFLTDEEFEALPAQEKTLYLTMASQQIESRQERLRSQAIRLLKERQQTKS